MLNWLHERDPVRYDVYCTQIKVAAKAGLIDQITVSLDQVQLYYFEGVYFSLLFCVIIIFTVNQISILCINTFCRCFIRLSPGYRCGKLMVRRPGKSTDCFLMH